MKINRLNLQEFKAKNLVYQTKKNIKKLLGQTLGDCHETNANNSSGTGSVNGHWDND